MTNVFLLSQVGFVLRATCLNPAEYNLPGCTDLQFFREWDPGFVNIINNEFPTVSLLKLTLYGPYKFGDRSLVCSLFNGG